jgi:hypothetical protein
MDLGILITHAFYDWVKANRVLRCRRTFEYRGRQGIGIGRGWDCTARDSSDVRDQGIQLFIGKPPGESWHSQFWDTLQGKTPESARADIFID